MRWALVLSCLTSMAVAPIARADDELAQARAAFDRADFDEAVALFDRAAEGTGLDRAEVLALLEGRAIARHAARDVAGAERDLVALLSLEPEAELGETAPPALQRAFARLRGEVRGRLSIEVEAMRVPDAFVIRAHVSEDVASLVREIRVRWDDEGSWREERGREVRIVAGSHLRYYVEAIGPGGAVIASAGSPEDPRTIGAIEAPPEQEAPQGGDDTALWVGLGIGAGVIVATIAIVIAVVLATPARTQPSAPMELP